MRTPALALLLLAGTGAAALAQADRLALPDWSTADLSWLSSAGQFAQSQAICASVLHAEPPPADYPSPAEAAALDGCDSTYLYYGVGQPQDRVAARQCAMLEREQQRRLFAQDMIDPYPLLDGSGTLATIYANGQGAARNYDVAIHMACEMNGAPAEMEGRIMRLADMRDTGWQGDDFHPCDDVTSGLAAGYCSALYAAEAADRRGAREAAAMARWPAPQRQAFAATMAAFTDYAEVANLLNCNGGTLAPTCRIGGTQDMVERYSARLLALAARAPFPPEPERDDMDGGLARTAVMTQAEWQALLADLYAPDRPQYEAHHAQAIAARQGFEPTLVAFARMARPDLTAHQVRVLFRDL
ncbi:MAG: hypothetical protein KDE15_07055 [Erythrobacter sp.]|nr:hypothetical protein [Erythrobacter sp.]